MKRVMFGYVAVGACMAAISVFGGIIGAFVCLLAMVPALASMPRPTGGIDDSSQRIGRNYLRWLVSTGSFSLFVVCLLPFTQFPAIALVLVLLAPLLGTSGYAVSTALFDRSTGSGVVSPNRCVDVRK